jgi:hypothetical protein
MSFPSFFAEVPPLILRDPLAELLGTADGGLIEYHYSDAVKMAGHSCPTVAGAYLLAHRMLGALYPDEMPERGGLWVDFRGALSEGVTGVTASVMGLLTGAAGPGGFKGLGGNFSRANLLRFGADLPGEVRFRRQDNGESRTASVHLGHIEADARMRPLLQRLLSGKQDAIVAEVFAVLWQDRVRRILIDHFEDPEVVVFSPH